MSRKPNINWREGDSQKLERQVKRFNAKIYRTRSVHPELKDILPETIKKEDKAKMIEELKSAPRSAYNKKLHELERFSERGAEKEIVSKTGNRVTKWEKKEVSIKVAEINRERAIERKKVEAYEATSQGKKTGQKRGEMGSERLNALRPKQFDFDKIRPGKEWEKYKESVSRQANITERQKIMERYKQNYLKGLDNYGGYADDIKKIIEQLPANIVDEVYYREQEATISFYYESLQNLRDKDETLDILREIWQGALDEYVNKLHS
jgi:hypothetical protein